MIAKSAPIIEHCSEVRFGKYKCVYKGLKQHQIESHLFEIKNLWNDVQDFRWLREDQSPNWSVIPEEEWLALPELQID